IVIPEADQQRFLADFLPVLRSRLEITSRDGSVEIPARRPGRLTVTMTHDSDHRVGLSWTWRYPVGDDLIEIPVGDRARPELRDREAERLATTTAASLVAALPPLWHRGPLGPELVPRVGLTGQDALSFERDVLPALQSTEHLDVESAEGAVERREAGNAPVVRRSGSAEPATGWCDPRVTITAAHQDVPFVDLLRALATDQPVLILSSGTYAPRNGPAVQQPRALIKE